MATILAAGIVSSTSVSTMIVPSPEGNSRRTLLRAISGRRPVSGPVIRLEPERTATAAARRCRRAAVRHPGPPALPPATPVAHPAAHLVVAPDLHAPPADLAAPADPPDAVAARAPPAAPPAAPPG